jgi:glycerol uptake facilitator-like aquaporin
MYDPNKLIHPTPNANASATLFITAPASNVASPAQGFCQEVLASGILTISVLALGDEVSRLSP